MAPMGRVDTGAVFKHPVHCFRCDEGFYFTLRKIVEGDKARVDTGAVFKHPVHCFRCDEGFYFTLRKIVEGDKAKVSPMWFRYQSR
jgi:hypothetical protein